MSKRIVSIILVIAIILSMGISASAQDKLITAVDLPVSKTMLYSGANITEPEFYSVLDCVVDGKSVSLEGFSWSSTDYVFDKAGTYTFSAEAPEGYSFSCDVPKIKVVVKEGNMINCVGHFVNADNTGSYAMLKTAGGTTNRLYDLTGFNELRDKSTSALSKNVRLTGGLTKDADMPMDSHIVMESGAVTAMIGGSYGGNYEGTSIIEVRGGALDNVYAGSVNASYKGTTDIYVSGNPRIGAINCSSVYMSGARSDSSANTIVGSPEVSYDGTINIFFESDFSGEVTQINTDGAEAVNIYIEDGAKINVAFYEFGDNVNVYADGKKQTQFVKSISYDGADFTAVVKGTKKDDVAFNGTLSMTVNGNIVELPDVRWVSGDYQGSTEGIYTFYPVIPDSYYVSAAVEVPKVRVLVGADKGIKVTELTTDYKKNTVLPVGVETEQLVLPEKVNVTFKLAGKTYTESVEAKYSVNNYKSTEGKYTIKLEAVNSVFDIYNSVLAKGNIEVEVRKNAKIEKAGDVYEITSMPARFSGEERGKYRLTDASGIYVFRDNIDVIYSVYVYGFGVDLDINSDVVYVENKIDLNGATGTVRLDIPQALVTKVRYNRNIAGDVCINGANMRNLLKVQATFDAENKYFYANGIPAVIAAGENGGTYAYRANDMSLLGDINIQDWTAHGGTPKGNSCKTSNIAFVSGVVTSVFGGGHGTVEQACAVLDGGCATSAIYGGAGKGGTVRNVTLVLESGTARTRAYGSGSGGTTGYKNKKYGDDEYSLNIHMYGGAFSYVRISGTGYDYVYGNVNMIQHGGKVIYIGTGSNTMIYGNVDVTVYGGMWEKQYEHKSIEGKSTLRLYRDIVRVEFETFPYLLGDVDATFFDKPEDFEFIGYARDRQAVLSTEGDEGRLVVRFFETRYPDEPKYSRKIYNGTGDSIYITFPNGQNMLMDTGDWEGGPLIIESLRQLGVTKLDYVLITHNHSDHIGAVKEIAKAIPVKTFILQPHKKTNSNVAKAIKENGSEVIYLDRYKSLMVGDVEIYALNPTDPIQSDANTGSMATVLTFGESKVLLGADTGKANERDWMQDPILSEKIKDCTLLKLGHHGIQSSNCYEYIDFVNADEIVMTQMREYGVFAESMITQLTGVNGYDLSRIHTTGCEGHIKATLDGTRHGVRIVNEYNRITPYYADYTGVENVMEIYDGYGFKGEDLEKWNEAKTQIIYGLPYEKQNVVNGIAAYLECVGSRAYQNTLN